MNNSMTRRKDAMGHFRGDFHSLHKTQRDMGPQFRIKEANTMRVVLVEVLWGFRTMS